MRDVTGLENKAVTGDAERRATYLQACKFARDMGASFLQKMPLDDAAGSLVAAGASMMAAGFGAAHTAHYLRELAKQIETARAPAELN